MKQRDVNMNMKRITLITFLLLAVLAIGAVSASDDIASDGLNASEDTDIAAIGDYDINEHGIEVNEEEICIDEDNDEYDDGDYIAYITLPDSTKNGRFQILNGEEEVAYSNVNLDDDDHWELDEDDGILYGSLLLSDFNLTKVHDGNLLTFVFLENGGNPVDLFTKEYKVKLTATTMKLLGTDGGMTEDDIDIQVTDIDTTKPDENFTYVYVSQKEGIFIITVEGADDEYVIIRENLNTTGRPYVKIDKEGEQFYRFGFSFTDLNNYIAQNIEGINTFNDLVSMDIISSGDEMYFEIYEYDEEDDEETEIYSKTMTFKLNSDKILFKSDEEDVEIDYPNLNVIMYDGWQETELLVYTVREGIAGKIVIYLNDNQTPAFEKDISELTPDDEEDDFNYYIIKIKDLNITQAGEYIIRDYFDNEFGEHIYKEDYPETLVLKEPQIMIVDGVKIEVNPFPVSIESNESLITINASASEDDEILICVDGSEEPAIFKLIDCGKDDYGNYTITNKQLNLGIGQHDLNITYKGINLTAKVNIITNIVIELAEEDEIIYTTFNDAFVFISLENDEDDIYTHDIEGRINLTLTDSAGTIIITFEDINELSYDEDLRAYLICTEDINAELNGTYAVVVKYLEGDEVATQKEGNVTFKQFDSEEYGTSISNSLNGENDYVATFTDLPLSNDIIIEIDGNETVTVNKSSLRTGFDSQGNRIYYITYDDINGLTEGSHSIRVYIATNKGKKDLANGAVFVDVKENIDPALNIDVSDIKQGDAANVVITTNSTFTGEVIVQVANKNYTVNVVNGKGSISISGLAANTYTATAFLKSNGIFKDSTKTTTFKVTSKEVKKSDVIKLTLKKVKVKKSAKKLVLQATLKINGKAAKGKKIIFKFNGKTYTAKTNKKGVAKVTIKKKVLKKLKVGKKVKYQASYGKTIKKYSVKVKK